MGTKIYAVTVDLSEVWSIPSLLAGLDGPVVTKAIDNLVAMEAGEIEGFDLDVGGTIVRVTAVPDAYLIDVLQKNINK